MRRKNRTNGKSSEELHDSATPAGNMAGPSTAEFQCLSLSQLDWIAAGLIATALIAAPLWAAGWSTPGSPLVFSRQMIASEGEVSIALDLWGPSLVLMLATAAVLVVAWREWRRPVAIGAVRGLTGSVALLGVWAVLSAAPGQLHYLSINALAFLAAGLFVGALIARLGRDIRASTVVILSIAAAGSVIGGIGVREYLGELRNGVIDHRTFATFGPDFLAGYLLLTLPLTLAAFAAAPQRLLKLVLGIGLALQSGCLFLTGSRAGTAIALGAVVLWVAIALFTGTDRGRRRWLVSGVLIFLAASALSAAPILGRYGLGKAPAAASAQQPASAGSKPAEDTQAHSAAFRKSTWIGASRMAIRNPLIGTGIGTFAAAYPRYADTKYTAHAHNSFLQLAGELGFPAAGALLAAFAAASAFIAHVLLLIRSRAGDTAELGGAASVGAPILDAPGLLLAGLVSGLTASTVHNMFDSDLYIVATLLTFCGMFGLSIALARAVAPLAPNRARPVDRETWAVAAILAILIAVRAGQIGAARWYRAAVDGASSGAEAIEHAKSAAAIDPFDPEPHLVLAQLLRGRPETEQELQTAVRLAPSNKTYYLLGRYYRELAEADSAAKHRGALERQAVDAFERSVAFDPHNVQPLRALAETEAESGVDQNDPALLRQARYTYQTITALETMPYGRIRAVPEIIETDFAFAHAGLGDLSERAGRPAEARAEFREALRILRSYWERRNWSVNILARSPEKRHGIAELYSEVLGKSARLAAASGAADEAHTLDAEQSRIRTDAAADSAADSQQKAQ